MVTWGTVILEYLHLALPPKKNNGFFTLGGYTGIPHVQTHLNRIGIISWFHHVPFWDDKPMDTKRFRIDPKKK